MSRIAKKSLFERINSYLHAEEWFFSLSETLEIGEFYSLQLGNSTAFSCHVIFLVAQANSRGIINSKNNVFDDKVSRQRWLSLTSSMTLYLLTIFSILNVVYTFTRKRHYRMFERPKTVAQQPQSLRLVRIDSHPSRSLFSLQNLNNFFKGTIDESSTYLDPKRDVWEIAVWDPYPICLRISCLMSPGHVLIYWLFLPTDTLDPLPSMTAFKLFLLQIFISSQLLLFQAKFSQQVKDISIVHGEVLNEYDVKFVRPKLNPHMRDFSTQSSSTDIGVSSKMYNTVTTNTPSFRVNQNSRVYHDQSMAHQLEAKSQYTPNHKQEPISSANTPSDQMSFMVNPSLGYSSRSTPWPFRPGRNLRSATTPDQQCAEEIYEQSETPAKRTESIFNARSISRRTTNSFFNNSSWSIKDQGPTKVIPTEEVGSNLASFRKICPDQWPNRGEFYKRATPNASNINPKRAPKVYYERMPSIF
ncbi:BgTH12-05237 [Blumeria graminis f. sp. triticale]|nr:BgTH12-05237 [Blumeria graminis f. sp. triticale]